MSILDLQQNTIHTATPSELDRIRYPQQYFTDGYLNDPIQFSPDTRFDPQTNIQQRVLPDQIERDFASFLQIDSNNSDAQQLGVSMFSSVWDRINYEKVMGTRLEFTFFGT